MTAARPSGVIAAIVTPIDAAGAPDAERFVRHARWLMANGCDGLNVLGTTGEATSFSADQRRALMTAAAEAMPDAPMMVGTGCPDLPTTIALTRHAHAAGFAAALVLPPYYYKGVGDDGLFAFFAALVAATANAPIPIYLYNFPQMTGLRFSPELVGRLADEFSGRIVGAKDSSGDLDYAAELARIDGFDVFPSDEGSLSQARARGFAGCISATVNLSAPLAGALWRAPDDAAMAERVRAARAGIAAQPLVPAVKQLVGELHGDEAYAVPLPPFVRLTEEQKSKLPDLASMAV
ncbi:MULTISPECIES: dihydrodipicolinate synthase family protein [unclassified Roseitalea]|uniref:dihydrodipicolinate synthase family protein n=1 Tax=unclassified Roseitalea TaxID=2639107 RepID=UPI00273CF84D|nr:MULTISPECIES: dihydrodipicolinate synthase family protein [unclassified Roseitalea]